MLAGQEAMSGWLSVFLASQEDWEKMADAIDKANGKAKEMSDIKMNTLEGDVKTLGSAFEALQLEIFTGDGSKGLRSFTQALTDDIRFIQNAIKDGFDIGDIGGLLAKVATQLKDKFLAFDGVGSILAGGALVMGLKKIYDLTMRIKDAAITARSWWQGAATVGARQTMSPATGGAVHSVGTMNVTASVVNINGRVSNGTTPATTGGQSTRSGTITGGQSARGGSTTVSGTATSGGSTVSRLSGARTAAAGAGIITTIFAIMDTFTTRNANESRVSEVQATYDEAKNNYNETKAIYDAIAEDEERQGELPQAARNLQEATQKLEQSSSDLKTVQKEAVKYNNESFFGGAGAVAGATTGAAIGSVIPGLGTVTGAVVGIVLSMLGASIGAEVGKTASNNFDFDVLGWLKGENSNKSRIEEAVAKADWVTDSGKKFSDLSAVERIEYWQKESETERTNRLESQSNAQVQAQREEFGEVSVSDFRQEDNAVTAEYKRQQELRDKLKYTDFTHAAAFQPQPVLTSSYDTEQAKEVMNITTNKPMGDKIQNEVDYFKKLISFDENKTDYSSFFSPNIGQSSVTATQYDTESVKNTAEKSVSESVQDRINSLSENRTDFTKPVSEQSSVTATQYDTESAKNTAEKSVSESVQDRINSLSENRTDFTKPFTGQSPLVSTPYNAETMIQSARKTESDVGFLQSAGNFFDDLLFSKAAANPIESESSVTETADQPLANTDTDLLPEFNLSEWMGGKTADLSKAWSDFNVSDLLPEFNLSEWIGSQTQELPDITSIISESLSASFVEVAESIHTSIDETFTGITENVSTVAVSIGESFSQIPVAASTSFNEIVTAANEGWTTIQAEWSQLPSFFESLWAGAGAAASSAGAAIASGLTSVIGGIIGAWQSAASTIGSIISNIANMASNAASTVANFSIGSNATGTTSWQGGFTEINEQGGEIIDLPRGTRIYPHATTMKLLQRDIEQGKFNSWFSLDVGHNATGTISWSGGLTEVNEQGGEIIDLPEGTRIYPYATAMNLLQRNIEANKISGLPLNSTDNEFTAFPKAINFDEFINKSISNSTSTTNNNGVTVSGNTFNVRTDFDINEIAFRLFELMSDSNANYAGA